MNASFSLSIPHPCSEDWKTFTPTATGGFCGRCQKNVIDFTKATDDEIIAFISKKPEHVCGRFRSNQLKAYTIIPPLKIRPGFVLVKAGITSLLLLLVVRPSFAQVSSTDSVEVVQSTRKSDKSIHAFKIVIRGKVISSEDSTGMPGVSVLQKGTVNGTVTDYDGTYKLSIDSKGPQILIFSFIGMSTQEISLPSTIPSTVNITMFPDITGFLGEVIWTGGLQTTGIYAEKRSGLKNVWQKIKSWF